MRILYVCHRFPFPPIRGGKIRPFNMIRHFSREHRVTVASLLRSDEEAHAGEGLREHCDRVIAERVRTVPSLLRMIARLPRAEPSSFGWFYAPRLARRLRAETADGSYDLVFVHCSSVAGYVESVDGPAKILDFGDMDSQKWLSYGRFKPFPLSLGYRLEGRKLERREAGLARRFDLCTCTTRAELETLEGFGTGLPADWFPNGVDADRFRPTDEPHDPERLCFVGRMDYFPNQQCVFEICREVLPLVRARRPGVRLVIVGADPPRAVRELGRLPGVEVTGSVPEVQSYARRAALTLATLRIARGTQNKILESMAMGVPVVATSLAAAGVDVVPGEHLLTADDPRSAAEAVLRILDDPAERRRLATAGRARVLSHHSWAASMKRLDAIVNRATALAAARRGGSPS